MIVALKFITSIGIICILLSACNFKNADLGKEILVKEAVTATPKKVETEIVPTKIIQPKIVEVDYSQYFGNYEGSAVFYNAKNKTYEIYNLAGAKEQRSPCSTFKIISTLAALEYGVITEDNSLRKWSKEKFWKADWNTDIALEDAFKTSCVWYYRQIINEIGQEKMQSFIDKLGYGNQNVSDWQGKLNKNNNNLALTGFWIESSLLISPIEQVNMLCTVFGEETSFNANNVQILKNIMKVDQQVTDKIIYGKTGYGKLKEVSLDSWFVGMFEADNQPTYFALHLSESTDPKVSSALAKEIALKIIADK